MSTRSTIVSLDNFHIYYECMENFDVYLEADSPPLLVRLCSEKEWREVNAQIIRHFCQKLLVSSLDKSWLPEEIWTREDLFLDKEKLKNCFGVWVDSLNPYKSKVKTDSGEDFPA